MKLRSFVLRQATVATFAGSLALAGCDVTENPMAPDPGATIVLGQVASVAAEAVASGGATVSGIEVSIEGGASDVTDASGNFHLEADRPAGMLSLRFRRGTLDVRLDLPGAAPGSLVNLQVGLDSRGATVLSSSRSRDAESEGHVTTLSVLGDAPSRVVRATLSKGDRSGVVEIVEGVTEFDRDGDVLNIDEMLTAMARENTRVWVEAHGDRQDDGTIVARRVEVEIDEGNSGPGNGEHDGSGNDNSGNDNEGDDDGSVGSEREGVAVLVSIEGDAPTRTLLVALSRIGGTRNVSIAEGSTAFDQEGDIRSFSALLDALDRADPIVVRIEARGTVQEDGSLLARSVKAETDEGDDDGVGGVDEVEGVAALLGLEGAAPDRTVTVAVTRLAGMATVDIVEGSTTFDAEGDLRSIDSLLAALGRSDLVVRVEARVVRRADGSLVATMVKVETDRAS